MHYDSKCDWGKLEVQAVFVLQGERNRWIKVTGIFQPCFRSIRGLMLSLTPTTLNTFCLTVTPCDI